jgi:hypothetical protein
MNATRLAAAPLNALQRDLRGESVQPGDAGYDRARAVYNTIHERWPALIVRAAAADDVARTVRFAADEGLMLAVRGGNHSMRGHGSCDDGVVLDLSRLSSVEVDADAGVAVVGGGATWADVNEATHRHGLATTGGVVSTTGVAGLTLGGGFGYLTRRLGLACDNLVAAEVVTAGGEVLAADAERASDLFWALRGGGGNFGVVTSFSFRLAPVDTVLAGPLVFAPEARVVERYQELVSAAPRALGAVLGLTLAPPLPALDPERHGAPCAVVVACWSGEASEGREVLHELEGLGSLWGGLVREMAYPQINTLFDDLLPHGLRHYWKSAFVDRVPSSDLDPWIERGRSTPNPESGIFFYPVGGAAADVDDAETAWAHRDARFLAGFHGSWRNPALDGFMRSWVRDAHAACAPSAGAGEYVNFASDEDGTAASSYGAHVSRLVETKRRYDPHNLFCLNVNVDPG